MLSVWNCKHKNRFRPRLHIGPHSSPKPPSWWGGAIAAPAQEPLPASSTSFGWGNGGNVTSARWQVIQCDPIWHVSSRSGEASR